MRKDTPNRVKSAHARKFARGVNRIHHDDSRNPVGGFTLAKAISYKGDDESLSKATIQMHFDSVVGATDWRDGSTVSVLRAPADAQAAEKGDATDEVPTMSFKSLRYQGGALPHDQKPWCQSGPSRSCAHLLHPSQLELDG
jgi:hypothetical protein